MEASETTGTPAEPQAPAEPAQEAPQEGQPLAQGAAFPGVPEGEREAHEPQAVPTANDELPAADSEERNPAVEQSPTATAAQDAVVGDPGLRDEQQPISTIGGSENTPHRTSPPPPSAQSGVPLPEDRAAGVQPGPKGPVLPVDESAEAPAHDASEGQSTTPPLGG